MAAKFASLNVTESAEGVTRTRSGGKYADNPLATVVGNAAKSEGKAFNFTIPQADVAEAETLLRAAADALGKGIAISYPSEQETYTNRKGNSAKRRVAKADDKGKTKVTFEVRPRREVKRRTAEQIAADNAAAPAGS